MPFLFGGIFAFFVFEQKEKSIVELEPKVLIKEINYENINFFIEKNNYVFEENGFEKALVKKDDKIYSYKNLTETKKLIIKMIMLNKIQKNFSNIMDEENLKIIENETLQNFQKKIKTELAKIKDTIYKIHKGQLHPLDKDLLENLK